MNRFTIALSGLSDTDAAMFEAALGALPNNGWHMVENGPADLLVVDIDTVWGHMDWLRATANGQQVVAYTKDEHVRHCDLLLTKPLRTRDLAELLDELASHGGVKPVAPKADAPAKPKPPVETPQPAPAPVTAPQVSTAPKPAPVAAVAPVSPPATAPTKPLPPQTLGKCLLDDTLSSPCLLRGTDGTVLQLDPERGGYTGPATLKPLTALLDLPMNRAEVMSEEAVKLMREAPALPLTRLLWFAALCATPGELATHLDPAARYRLTRWPQIEREFPRHFRIATSMMKGPASIGDIASMANAPESDVADFISAYSVAGYVSSADAGNADSDADNEGGSGMFSRLRRPFLRGGQAES